MLVGVAEGGTLLDTVTEARDLIVPELGFDAAEAALDPLGGDEGVDERELVGIVGVEVEEKLGGEGF